MTMNEVGDDRADRRRGSADSSKVEQDVVSLRAQRKGRAHHITDALAVLQGRP